MIKVEFDPDTLLKDILSQYGIYVDLLSCNEYTIWYLIRQAGIKAFIPALHTKSFLTTSLWEIRSFWLYQDNNLKVIIDNLTKYYGIGIVQYEQSMGGMEAFILNGISRNQFVYTLYDYYYDTLLDEMRRHDYHGHPVTGYDEDRQVYVSIYPDKFEVRHSDLQKMVEHCFEKFGTYVNNYFYLDIPNDDVTPSMEVIKKELCSDCRQMLWDWTKELELFRNYVDELPKVIEYTLEDKLEFVLNHRFLFNSILEGMHGNFIFKLNLVHEVMHVDTTDLINLFLANRRKGIVIANMYRKASIILEDGPEYFAQIIQRISAKISEVFIRESEELLLEYEKLMKREGWIERGI